LRGNFIFSQENTGPGQKSRWEREFSHRGLSQRTVKHTGKRKENHEITKTWALNAEPFDAARVPPSGGMAVRLLAGINLKLPNS
jgi:hypothetical protein